ncbi:MAG: hypothetical protein L6Q81_08050 [Bacteroidia bacterium]|nr:hypothetical protein [Bacteroidia bacterium]
MSATDSIKNTDNLNYLNIGLMLLACGVAFFVPFELFLIVYAVLGPAHYLTEISWLHERKYFSRGKWDFVFLSLAAIALFVTSYVLRPNGVVTGEQSQTYSTAFVYIAFISALAMVVLKTAFQRLLAVLVIMVSAIISKSAMVFFSVFLPTLIHVYLFTGLFMLYGAMKGRSKSGYLSCLVFILIPFLFVFIHPESGISEWARRDYSKFEGLNLYILNLWDSNIYSLPVTTKSGFDTMISGIYQSQVGVAFMRFIAFAYTYHYLNWFSKTTVIKWHQIPKMRMTVIVVLWLVSVGLYYYDYRLGFDVLFLISFLHVFLEFPLNHVSFIGIYTEAKAIFSGSSVQAQPIKGKKR